ncbi:ComEA family DNA-binding protein [Cellulomonas aerilata]|uniref:Helix-hairpin-helix DNA-binding motif class 1 domain-containing protein n=1 Tax=Cellulomonas aerilata TaxID=515326 RepID=A0A512DBS9_9CELL|nr:ComEA family DNA-binding protein [Cellulomonas aerilata]GEO33905.1 hypothetical protein CAE01nite_16300 [Cellulomonas aerilata]
MPRSDDALRSLSRDRLHAVARPGSAAPGGAASEGLADARVDGEEHRGGPRAQVQRPGPAPWWLPEPPEPPGPAAVTTAPGFAGRVPTSEDAEAEAEYGKPVRHPVEQVRDGRGDAARPEPATPRARRRGRHQAPATDAGTGTVRVEPPPSDDAGAAWLPVAVPAEPPAYDVASRADRGPTATRGPVRSSPPPAATVDRPHREGDVRDVVERMRREALAEVADEYGRRHGHPLDHAAEGARPARRRWFLGVRHAVVAGVAVAVLTAGVVLRATAEVPRTVPPPASAAASAVGAARPGDDGTPDVVAADAEVPPAPAPGSADGGPSPSPAGGSGAVPAPAPTARVVVHVVGQVSTPGVVDLPVGARVGDALAAAGGATPTADLSGVNLARVLVDGEQVVVPAPGDAPVPAVEGAGGGPGAASGGTAATGPVDLNTAGAAELDGLPGIGPVLAQRILEWRTEHGPFRDVEELGEVAGIGDTLLGRLRTMVRV